MATNAGTAWRISLASVQGKGHIDRGIENQDCVSFKASARGDVVCAVVSDGAGTAPQAAKGSRTTAQMLTDSLFTLGRNFSHCPLIERFQEAVFNGIVQVRNRLAGEGANLHDFHCTLNAWLYTQHGSFLIQVGDGVALSSRFLKATSAEQHYIDFFPDSECQIHDGERGEYANETHFITESDWQRHVRITPVPLDAHVVILMSDGAMEVAISRGKVFRGFLSKLVAKLYATNDPEQRNTIVNDWLADPQANRRTADDKTMFVALREIQLPDFPILTDSRTIAEATAHLPPVPSGAPDAVASPIPEEDGSATDAKDDGTFSWYLATTGLVAAFGLALALVVWSVEPGPEPDSKPPTIEAPWQSPGTGPHEPHDWPYPPQDTDNSRAGSISLSPGFGFEYSFHRESGKLRIGWFIQLPQASQGIDDPAQGEMANHIY